MKELFAQFLKEKEFLCSLSPRTLDSYQQAFNCYVRLGGAAPSKESLKDFVVKMRESGLSPGGCNVYIRSINSFLTWLHEGGYVTEPLRLRQLPQAKVVVKVFTEAHIQALIQYRPKDKFEHRLHTLICLLIDGGFRIDEVMGATLSGLDLDQLLIKVRGKGNKERVVPISIEMRKILWLYINRYRFKVGDYLFPTQQGRKLGYHNVLRDIKELCSRLRIEGVRLSPHGFRHHFAVQYLRRGGDVYRLSRILGHSEVSTTSIYLRSMGVEMVQEIHQQLSPLSQNR